MLDSLLTLTKGAAFWMGIFFVVAIALHFAVSSFTGTQEPIFLLIAAFIPVAMLVMGAYTLGKRLFRR